MLTAILLDFTGRICPAAPAGFLSSAAISARLRIVADAFRQRGQQISWLTDSDFSPAWPEAGSCGEIGPAILGWLDSSRDYWLLASAASLRALLPQIDRLLLFKARPVPDLSDDELLYELCDLTTLGYCRAADSPDDAGAALWQRPSGADLISRLVAAGNCDLHLHTNRSDGADSPEELVDRVLAAGLEAFAITDHDNLAALEPARAYLAGRLPAIIREVQFIPGVELSVEADRELHLLGYFPRGGQAVIEQFLERQRETRRERNRKMIEHLQNLGYAISMADFDMSGEGTVGRLQAALVLRDRGHFATIDEAFDQLLGYGRPGYVDRPRPCASEAIWLIRSAGGVAVLAHPADYGWCSGRPVVNAVLTDQLEALKAMGLQGVEAFHGEATIEHQLEISAAARALGLVRSAGSDDHGLNKAHAHLYPHGSRWLDPNEILVVAALIAGVPRNGQPTWLLTRRCTPGTGQGLWELPGGKVEPGETPAAALIRELREELAVTATIGRRRQILTYAYPTRRVILVSLEAELQEKTWQLSVHDDARFVTAEEALDMPLLPADVILFENLLN